MNYSQDSLIPSLQQSTIQVCLTGTDITINMKMSYVQPLKIMDIMEKMSEKCGRILQSLRLFTSEGVEIYKDDLKFVKNNTILYATEGQDFDQTTSFSIYQIIRELGEGGFGKVLLGRHKITNETVAIKVIDTSVIGNAQVIDMVFREAELMKCLRHKNIVNIMNCYTLPNMQVVIIMEYLQGGQLSAYLEERGRLYEDEARFFFQQIVEAIQYCHSQKLIHRDLKLENILLKSKATKVVKIVDFGIAGLTNAFNTDKLEIGTLTYMAPELINGNLIKVGPSVDIWSLGVILYALICGSQPFTRPTQIETIEAIANSDYQIPQHLNLSMGVKDLIQRMLTNESDSRLKMIEIINHPWMKQSNDPAKVGPAITLSPNKKLGFRETPKPVNIIKQSTMQVTPSQQSKILNLTQSQSQIKQIQQPGIKSFGDQTQISRVNSVFVQSSQPSQAKIEGFTKAATLWEDLKQISPQANYPLISVIENEASDRDQQPQQEESQRVQTQQSCKGKKLITKNYDEVLKRFKGMCKTFKSDISFVVREGDLEQKKSQRISKASQSMQKLAKIESTKQLEKNQGATLLNQQQENKRGLKRNYSSLADINEKSNKLSQRTSMSKQQATLGEYQERTNKASQRSVLGRNNFGSFIDQRQSLVSLVSFDQTSDLILPAVSKSIHNSEQPMWLRKIQGVKIENQYKLQANFMERKKHMDTLYDSTFGNHIKQARSKRDSILRINQLYCML